jgi:hypothetical protein
MPRWCFGWYKERWRYSRIGVTGFRNVVGVKRGRPECGIVCADLGPRQRRPCRIFCPKIVLVAIVSCFSERVKESAQ